MKSKLVFGVAALLCAVLSAASANADTVIFTSVPDLGGYAFNNAYCSDCGPLAGDEPLAVFSLSSPVSITGLNSATGSIYGDSIYAGLDGAVRNAVGIRCGGFSGTFGTSGRCGVG
jgi:hypothetical protein